MLNATLSFCVVVLANDPSTPEEKIRSGPPEERGAPALFSWGDLDGDSRLDLATVSAEGALQLLANSGEGRFEDVTDELGLAGVTNAALALWIDYDADGGLDLFVGARAGASRLFHNEGGLFVDMTTTSGFASEGEVQSAHWLDHDGDGRLDLHVVTAGRNELFRGLEGGFFERSELPAIGSTAIVPLPGGTMAAGDPPAPAPPGASFSGDGTTRRAAIDGPVAVHSRSPIVLGPGSVTSGTTSIGLIASCFPAIRDQANPAACLQASSTPTLGRLYPISSNLFVAVGGNVGIGTTTPSERLEVAGTARITDTLTLAPAGDQALAINTGSIYKNGALFINTKGAARNTALGLNALPSVTTGGDNTASGYFALLSNTTGYHNTAIGSLAVRANTTGSRNTASGYAALSSNTTGSRNTACGERALRANTTGYSNTAGGAQALQLNTSGYNNTASGYRALYSNTTGYDNTACGGDALGGNGTGSRNTACGRRALLFNSTGFRNIAVGYAAGSNLTTGSYNIAIGNYGVAGDAATIRIGALAQTRAFIAGIRGVPTGIADAIPVLVDSAGQLGTVSSSRRFKEEIRDMGELSDRLLELRPVVFRYRPEVQSGERPLEYGLIAEEVAEVFPELVVLDEDGQPFTVKYHLLSSMLLNEVKELHERCRRQEARLAALEARVASATAGFR